MNLTTDKQLFIQEICHIWQHNFLQECARFAEQKPYLSEKQLEAMAAKIATLAMYYDQKDELSKYKRNTMWRIGGE